jgi:hypothetical protein
MAAYSESEENVINIIFGAVYGATVSSYILTDKLALAVSSFPQGVQKTISAMIVVILVPWCSVMGGKILVQFVSQEKNRFNVIHFLFFIIVFSTGVSITLYNHASKIPISFNDFYIFVVVLVFWFIFYGLFACEVRSRVKEIPRYRKKAVKSMIWEVSTSKNL